jgi:hypothetical protein
MEPIAFGTGYSREKGGVRLQESTSLNNGVQQKN